MMQRSVTTRVGPLVVTPLLLPIVATLAVTKRGHEFELVHEAALRLGHHDEDLAAGGCDLRRAAAARQPHLRFAIGANHRGVDIGEAVELGGRPRKARV